MELLTVNEIAEALRVHPETVRRWIADGRMEAARLPGGEYRIPRATLDRISMPVGAGEQMAAHGYTVTTRGTVPADAAERLTRAWAALAVDLPQTTAAVPARTRTAAEAEVAHVADARPAA